jgi:hypothetical protein
MLGWMVLRRWTLIHNRVTVHSSPATGSSYRAAGAAHGTAYHPEHAYDFGLQRVLDGLACLVEATGRRTRP